MTSRWRIAGACMLAAMFVVPAISAPAATAQSAALPRSPADPHDPIGDPRLRDNIAAANRAGPRRGEVVPMVGVEVLTASTSAVARRVKQLGGIVTGSVDGHVVQVRVPTSSVDALALSDGVRFVQAPHAVTRPPVQQPPRIAIGPGTGATVGSNVALTNAQAWQAAGVSGSVKVGIVDYFDRGLWNTDEEGPIPDSAHIFCLDTFQIPISVCDPGLQLGINNGDGFEHGVAVAQVIKDMAPGAELYLATVSTASDLRAAIDWFAQNGVSIISRSLGAAYDGPGDGSGPLDSVVDYATSKGITWFNSAGNDAADNYARVTVPLSLDYPGTADDGYVDFDNGPGVDTYLRVSGGCYTLLDGFRWSDWALPADLRTDYSFEAYEPISNPDLTHRIPDPSNPAQTIAEENYNPTDLRLLFNEDANQAIGAPPLEMSDGILCPSNSFGFAHGISYIRIKRKVATPTVGPLDTLEFALGSGYLELNRSQAAYSASKPVVDSRSPMLVAVGAIDPAIGQVNPVNTSQHPEALAPYSSQGPTNDGRIKPDVSAPSCFASTIYTPSTNPPCFNGTSAAAPTVAGMAALILAAGIALPGPPLAAAVRHFTFDRNVVQGNLVPLDGPDNKYGYGQVRMPAVPPPAVASSPSVYVPLLPTRILDTRSYSPVGPAELVGERRQYDIVDLMVASVAGVPSNASAVAVNITSVGAPVNGFIQAVPYLRSTYGSSSTLNVSMPGSVRPNFAIVPVGVDGKISLYDVPGGHLVVDLLGYFLPAPGAVSAGRMMPIVPERVLDTRTTTLVPLGWLAHKPVGQSVIVPAAAGVPTTGVSALVLNVTATEAEGSGFLRAQPTATVPSTSTVNYTFGIDSANTVIVPLGADGTVSIFTSNATHIVVDVAGYVADGTAPISSAGLFVAVPTGRAYDSRNPPATALVGNTVRTVGLAGLVAPLPSVPVGASAISLNLTAADETGPGFLTAYPSGAPRPGTSSLNFAIGQPVANGAVLKLSDGGALDLIANLQIAVIIDINGYFTG